MRKSLTPDELKRLAAYLGGMGVALLLFYQLSSHLTFIDSRSIPYHLMFLKKHPDLEEMKPGQYVLFEKSFKIVLNGHPLYLVKQITCGEGERLDVVNREYFCNKTIPLGTVKDFGKKGEILDHFWFNGEIPKGMLFVSGRSVDSYDSRYWGFVKKSEVKAIAVPIY